MYSFLKDNLIDFGSAIIHILDFYIGTKNASNIYEVSIHFSSLVLSLFKIPSIKKFGDHIQRIVSIFFDNLKGYFTEAQSAESHVKKFWDRLNTANPRSFFGLVEAFSGVFTSVMVLYTHFSTAWKERDIYTFVTEITKSILTIGSDIRSGSQKITVFLARVYDFIVMNSAALMRLDFSNLKWNLPEEHVFETEFVQLENIIKCFNSDPLYLESINISLSMLRERVYKLIEKGTKILDSSPVPSIKSSVARYLSILHDHARVIEAKMNPDNTKPQPLSITLLGSAGCGKSSAAEKIGLMMQKITGRVANTNHIKNRGGDPKFEENIDGSTDVIIFDDFANDQSTKMQTKDVLDIVNTTKEIIPKASVEEKGRHKYVNIGTIFTTNDVNLGMNCFKTASVDSLLRRMGIVVHLQIADQYRMPNSDRLDLNHPSVSDETFNTEVYDVTLKRPVGISKVNGKYSVNYAVIDYPRNAGNSSWRDAILEIQKILKTDWDRNLKRAERVRSKRDCCPTCGLPMDVCTCAVCAQSLGSKRELLDRLTNLQLSNNMCEIFTMYDDKVVDFSTALAFKISMYIFCKNYINYMYSKYKKMLSLPRLISLLLFIALCAKFCPRIIVATFISIVHYENCTYHDMRQAVIERNLELRTSIRESYKIRYSFYAATIFSGLAGIYALYRCVSFFTQAYESQHLVVHTPDIEVKFSHVKDRPIYSERPENTTSDDIGHFMIKPRLAHEAITTSPSAFNGLVAKSLSKIIINQGDNSMQAYSLPMGSERMIPNHIVPLTGNFDVKVERGDWKYDHKDVPQSYVRSFIKKGLIKNHEADVSLIHVPNAPPGKDLSIYLAEPGTLPVSGPAIYLHYSKELQKFEEIPVHFRQVSSITYTSPRGKLTQHVYECNAQYHTCNPGDCGQPLLYKNCIIGIHVAGQTGSSKFYCVCIDKSMLNEARSAMKDRDYFVKSIPPEPVLKNNLKEISIVDQPTDYVKQTLGVAATPIVSLGTVLTTGGLLYRPRAEKHYFENHNKAVTEQFGEIQSRPPKYENGELQINTTLEKYNTPKTDVPIALMDRAAADYLHTTNVDGETLYSIANDYKNSDENFFSVRSVQQAIDGDATGVIRGMPNSTSSGICYGGSKVNHLECDDSGVPVHPRQLKDYILKDLDTVESTWRSGKGTFDPFVRASKVNELLPWQKAAEKTRSVYGNDMVFFISATRAIIPIKHVLRHQRVSECFVGVNATSQEWEELHDYLTANGEFTCFICGDFSGYDTQLPSALMDKAAAIILRIYKDFGASDSDLEYLRGALSSVVSPFMIWEGNLLQFTSGQPSGQPLTVEMNSIINSILMRMAFFIIMDKHYPHIKNPKFRDYVRLAVYGDDNAMGVHKSIPEFNHTNLQKLFGEWGIKYTMADKNADSVPYQTIGEVSFLKRSFRYHEQLQAIVAPIERESIVKKFYWWTRPKNTPLTFPEQFTALCDSQLREAYLYGEDFYNDFVAKLRKVMEGSFEQPEDFQLQWNIINPPSCLEMKEALLGSYHIVEDGVIVGSRKRFQQ